MWRVGRRHRSGYPEVASVFSTALAFYFAGGLGLYLLFGEYISTEELPVLVVSFGSFLLYGALLVASGSFNPLFDNRLTVFFTAFFFAVAGVVANKWLSYSVNGNFYVFSEADAFTYHTESLAMSQMQLGQAFEYLSDSYSFDDWGAFVVTALLYKIAASPLIISGFYVFLGAFTATRLYDIAGMYFSKKYAFIAAMVYSVSSYAIYFYSTNLKESVMIFLAVMFFYHYYRFLTSGSPFSVLWALFMVALLMFYRPAVAMLLLGSGFVGYTLQLGRSRGSVVVAISLMLVVVFFFGDFQSTVDRYTMSGDLDRVIESRNNAGAIKGGGVLFNYVVIALAQTVGPFPTFSPDVSPKLALWAPGLLLRVLLFLPFWLGVYFIWKNKIYALYPVVLFTLLEMLSLVVIMEGLELRKGLPHMPFVCLISFWFLGSLETNADRYSRGYFQRVVQYSMIGGLALILLYNLRS